MMPVSIYKSHKMCIICTYLCFVSVLNVSYSGRTTPEEYISECNSGNVIGTRLRSGGMIMKTFIRRLRRCLVLEGTAIVSMTLNV